MSTYVIDPVRVVKLRNSDVRLCDVPLGREYVDDGRVRQTALLSPEKFEVLPLHARFKIGDEWGIKLRETMGYALQPNGPFGRPTSKQITPYVGQKVRSFEVLDRGPA